MNHTTLNTLVQDTIATVTNLLVKKGAEYAGDNDTLMNFKRNAANLELEPEQVWAVYAGKHWDAVMQYVKDQRIGAKQRERTEPISGRLDDLIVYCILMKAIVQEKWVQQVQNTEKQQAVETPDFLLKEHLPHIPDYDSTPVFEVDAKHGEEK